MKRITTAPNSPSPAGPYSQAVVSGNLVWTAGQIPLDASGNQPDSFEERVRQTLRNLEACLRAAGSDFNHVIKVNGYLTDPGQLEPFNHVYREFLGHAPPARTTVCVSLWGVELEIDCVAQVIQRP